MKHILSLLILFALIGKPQALSALKSANYTESNGRFLQIRVYLEGALMNNNNEVSSTGRPLMRDNLRINPINGQNYIPNTDPYQTTIGDVNLSLTNTHTGEGSNPVLCTIADPNTVFNINGENAIVDWIFVEIRKNSDYTKLLATRSGLLQRDGDVVDMDGTSPLFFPDLTDNNFYIVVRHRNHLGSMSQLVNADQLMDFTDVNFPLFDYGTTLLDQKDFTGLSVRKKMFGNYQALWAGDFNSNCKINCFISNDDLNIAVYEELIAGSPLTVGYFQGDFDLNGMVSTANQNNDAYFLELQTKNYPLNNTKVNNFDLFLEQVPQKR